jgi:aldehyde dehydrogenase (NAD+)
MDHTAIIRHQHEFFRSGKTMAAGFRRERLLELRAAIEAHEKPLLDALYADLRKNPHEAYAAEIGYTLGEIRHALRHLDRWIRPQRRKAPWLAWPATAEVRHVPLGVALIIGPWNYPLQLLLTPLVSAIAAGNTAVLKPSELAPHSSGVIAEMIRRCFQPEFAAVIEGGRETSEALLAQKFDKIFFTGSTPIGRDVMAAAARHLTPVTLELGGKSPAIVDASANIAVSARRIAWGKWINAGQTCIAPDYVLVERSRELALVEELTKCIGEFYGDDPATSDSYGRIVSDRHFDRLVGMIGEGTVAAGGTSSRTDRYVAPTILTNVKLDGPLMTEEIFGPLLPIIPIDDVAAAVSFVRSRPHPLAMYVFAEDDTFIDRIVAETTAGGVTVNGTLLHLTNPRLPFGGVGDSGMGAYHGMTGVRAFQHLKPILSRGTRPDPRIAYPPYTKSKLRIIRRLL